MYKCILNEFQVVVDGLGRHITITTVSKQAYDRLEANDVFLNVSDMHNR